MKTVLIEGDSTAYGYFAFDGNGWADRLKGRKMRDGLEELLESTMVVNLAYPGQTLSRLNEGLASHIKEYRNLGPVAVAAQVGLNEAKVFPPNTRPVMSPRLFGEQVAKFCDIVTTHRATPILVGQPPVDMERQVQTISRAVLDDQILAEYGEVMRTVAAEHGGSYADVRAAYESSGYSLDRLTSKLDNVHPGPLGHMVIAGAVNAALPEGF